ncbi:MAG: TetR family transcriptional regulator [Blastochloris sp.]|nr:TetR family transcriptional regulator [Blastochloris sp.]
MGEKQNEGRTRDADRSREAILHAAEQLFAQKGYDSTSLQEIGELAGVSRGTPGYFFGSKEHLYQAVLERVLQAEHDAMEQVRARLVATGATPGDVIAEVIRSHIDFLVRAPTFLQLMTRESLSGLVLRTTDTSLEVIQAGQGLTTAVLEHPDMRQIDPDLLLVSIIALCWMPLTHRETLLKPLGLDADDPDFIERLKQNVVDILLHGILLK